MSITVLFYLSVMVYYVVLLYAAFLRNKVLYIYTVSHKKTNDIIRP